MAAIMMVNIVLVAQHWAGGGTPNVRYLMPSMPIVASMVALSVVRLGGRWEGAALLLILVNLHRARTAAAVHHLLRTPRGSRGSVLSMPLAPEWLRLGGVTVAVVGCFLLLGSELWMCTRRQPTGLRA